MNRPSLIEKIVLCTLIFMVLGTFIPKVMASKYIPQITAEVVDSICIDFEGQAIPFEIVDRKLNGTISEAVRWLGVYKIVINKEKHQALYDSYQYSVIKFALLHECAHMRLGHLKHFDASMISKTTELFGERNADCLAANWFTVIDGKSRLQTAMSDLATLRIISPYSPRYNNIIQCSTEI